MGWSPLTIVGIEVMYNDATPEVRVFADARTTRIWQSNIAFAVFEMNSSKLGGRSYRDLTWTFYTGAKHTGGRITYNPHIDELESKVA